MVYTKNTLKEHIKEQVRSMEFDINYHLERYEDAILNMIKKQKEFSEYNLDSYEVKWLSASLDFIKGQKALLNMAKKR